MDQSVIMLWRSGTVSPSLLPLPTSSESKSFQPPGPTSGAQAAALANRRLTLAQSVSGVRTGSVVSTPPAQQ